MELDVELSCGFAPVLAADAVRERAELRTDAFNVLVAPERDLAECRHTHRAKALRVDGTDTGDLLEVLAIEALRASFDLTQTLPEPGDLGVLLENERLPLILYGSEARLAFTVALDLLFQRGDSGLEAGRVHVTLDSSAGHCGRGELALTKLDGQCIPLGTQGVRPRTVQGDLTAQ